MRRHVIFVNGTPVSFCMEQSKSGLQQIAEDCEYIEIENEQQKDIDDEKD